MRYDQQAISEGDVSAKGPECHAGDFFPSAIRGNEPAPLGEFTLHFDVRA